MLSNNESEFILNALVDKKRIDGRNIYDYRKLGITFGTTHGHVEAQLGNTRVFTQVSCEVVQPSPHKPTEGFVVYSTNISPMSSPGVERSFNKSPENIELTRIIERCLRESRVIETEGLCIVAGEKVWKIRVDITVIDQCGNVIDCACIAAVTALKHFKRPDITITGEEVVIHTLEERPPVPLSLHHTPFCVTVAFFKDGEYLAVDPTYHEERVMDGRITICMTIHKELCAIYYGGGVALVEDQIIRCCEMAYVKVQEIAQYIDTHFERISGEKMDGLPDVGDANRSIGKNIVTVTQTDTPVSIHENKTMDMKDKVQSQNSMDVDDGSRRSSSGSSGSGGDSDSEEEVTTTLNV